MTQGQASSGAPTKVTTQTVETDADANGIKTVVTITTDERGRRTKTVKKVQVTLVDVDVPKAVSKRRNLRKFGQVRGPRAAMRRVRASDSANANNNFASLSLSL